MRHPQSPTPYRTWVALLLRSWLEDGGAGHGRPADLPEPRRR